MGGPGGTERAGPGGGQRGPTRGCGRGGIRAGVHSDSRVGAQDESGIMPGGRSNRRRGDYFGRQARGEVEDDGWFVVRAAGSHGVADLVALKKGCQPLLVSCKLNGYLRPLEREDIALAAFHAGAIAMVAYRAQRGIVAMAPVR